MIAMLLRARICWLVSWWEAGCI